jgi:hypothetical protein
MKVKHQPGTKEQDLLDCLSAQVSDQTFLRALDESTKQLPE